MIVHNGCLLIMQNHLAIIFLLRMCYVSVATRLVRLVPIRMYLALLVFPHSLCERYDTISTKVYEDPHSTDDMVNLVQFLTKVGGWGGRGGMLYVSMSVQVVTNVGPGCRGILYVHACTSSFSLIVLNTEGECWVVKKFMYTFCSHTLYDCCTLEQWYILLPYIQ